MEKKSDKQPKPNFVHLIMNKLPRLLALASLTLSLLMACTHSPQDKPQQDSPIRQLKVYNQKPIPGFEFINQDSQQIVQDTVLGKIHVVDFFFTSCPTICPKMKANLLTVHDTFVQTPQVTILSHSIDTRHDSVPVLKAYSQRLEVQAPNWHFVTGEKEAIMNMAKNYMIPAGEDSLAPGGYMHSGKLILLDGKRDIRGFYDGTSSTATQNLIRDIKLLLHEQSR